MTRKNHDTNIDLNIFTDRPTEIKCSKMGLGFEKNMKMKGSATVGQTFLDTYGVMLHISTTMHIATNTTRSGLHSVIDFWYNLLKS